MVVLCSCLLLMLLFHSLSTYLFASTSLGQVEGKNILDISITPNPTQTTIKPMNISLNMVVVVVVGGGVVVGVVGEKFFFFE